MTDLEGQLAELLKSGVGDPPGPVTVENVRRPRTRRQAAAVAATSAVAAIIALAVAVLTGVFTGSGVPVTGTVRPAGGPSGWQLAHGRWVAMSAAPFRLCDPVSV
jgi:hypothetical protein